MMVCSMMATTIITTQKSSHESMIFELAVAGSFYKQFGEQLWVFRSSLFFLTS